LHRLGFLAFRIYLKWRGRQAAKAPARPAKDSVSAIFVHDGNLFMIQRQPRLRAFPGYHAFPGGKVDHDESHEPFQVPFLCDHEPRLMRALCRELQEELDFDLEAAISEGLVTHFSQLATATTPAFQAARFYTRFYRIELKREVDFEVDEREAARHGWFSAETLWQRYRQGRLLAVPPVVSMLKALSQDSNRDHIPDVDFVYDAEKEVPALEQFPDFWWLPVRSATLPPANRTNAFVVGGILVDPSPVDSAELERLFNTLARFTVKGILLTHHHGDHNQQADAIARRLDVPMHMSEDTHQRLQRKRGAGFFQGLDVQIVHDGQVLTQWLDQDVVVHAVPGHDEGQMALAPRGMEWFIVGDLIQGVGTVVIAAPEGDMTKYFATLERVIAMDPAIIIPSHGIAMGTTFRLSATLQHRRRREEQVLKLTNQGCSRKDVLNAIYKGLPRFLKPLALANIDAHLVKLRSEGRLD
jgi:glyoxylase-like metal-dependent hydrolase (beta-lactamase superfamily II)/8-oxo-dGTP pyrophosphatase MutT (NUDIX family)